VGSDDGHGGSGLAIRVVDRLGGDSERGGPTLGEILQAVEGWNKNASDQEMSKGGVLS